MRYFFFIVFTIVSCTDCPIIFRFADQTDYEIGEIEQTTTGINVDTSGLPIDLATIDRIFDEVEDCLYEKFPKQKFLDEYRYAYGCQLRGFYLPIKRECITVKIANDCTLSHDKTQELLSSLAPEDACAGKDTDEDPSEKFPCKWRAGIQDSHTIVTCPSMYLLKDSLVRITTGCNAVWSSEELSECAIPSTEALSGLVVE